MAAFLGMFAEKYGGAEGYVKAELGFSQGDVETIRRNLLAPSLHASGSDN